MARLLSVFLICVGVLGCASSPDTRDARLDEAGLFATMAVGAYERVVTEWAVPRYIEKATACRDANPDDRGAYDACMASAQRQVQLLSVGWQALQQTRYGLEAGQDRDQALACLGFAVGKLREGVEGLVFLGAADPPDWVTSALGMLEAGVRAFVVGGQCELEAAP